MSGKLNFIERFKVSIKSKMRPWVVSICRSQFAPSETENFWVKVFEIAPLSGDYVEFGVFRGNSFIIAHRAAESWVKRILSGRLDHLVDDNSELRGRVQALWRQRRFIGFDSFEGMPESSGIDASRQIWKKGTFRCSLDEINARILNAGVASERFKLVKGFFEDTLKDQTRTDLDLQKVAVAHIDSDLYSSAALALDFITPMLQNGTVIIFDEWFGYRGHPLLGEQKAFADWRKKNPEWMVTDYATHGPYAKSFIINGKDLPIFVDHIAELTE